MRRVIVNYHYIRAADSSGIHPCTIAAFKQQIASLAAHYTIVAVAEVVAAARADQPGNFCALTFDDGLAEHYTIVFPLLRAAKIPATFFPLGLPLADGRIPLPHKLHILLSELSAGDLVQRLERFFPDEAPINRTTPLNPRRRFDDVLTANLKETLIALPLGERERFIEAVFREVVANEPALAGKFFLSPDQLRELDQAGMEIGSHTYSHFALDTLAPRAQSEEIVRGEEVIASIITQRPRSFAYPHGRHTPETLSILEGRGYQAAYLLGAREVGAADGRFEIPRFDTNDVPALLTRP